MTRLRGKLRVTKSPTQHGTPATTIECIHERLTKGDGPSGDVIRQEAARAKLSVSTLEALLRLDKRFAKSPAGWEVRLIGDRWPDLVGALPESLGEGAEADALFRQVVIEMNAATRSHFAQYYPHDFVLRDGLLKQIAQLVESCPKKSIPQLKGPIFDLVMSELFDDADRNRFFTPRAVTAFTAAWACPQPGERIVDPCYGSGGFLVAMAQWIERSLAQSGTVVEDHSTLFDTSFRYVMNLGQGDGAEHRAVVDKMLHGMDREPAAAWSGKTNLALHGSDGSHLHQTDALDLADIPFDLEGFDVVAGNPPFGDKITDPAILEQFELGRDSRDQPLNQQASEVLFIEAFLRLAVPGGRVIILVPDGVLANLGEQRTRDYLVQHAIVEAVIGLPRRAFRNNAKANVLLLRKKHEPGQSQERPVFLVMVEDIRTELEEALNHYQAGPESR